MKLGIIRCQQTENYCPGTTDFKTVNARSGAFADIPADESVEWVGFVSCGGCPGKNAVLRAKEMVRRGADAIAFASCIQKGTPIGFACPNAEKMIQAVRKALGEEITILDHTH